MYLYKILKQSQIYRKVVSIVNFFFLEPFDGKLETWCPIFP